MLRHIMPLGRTLSGSKSNTLVVVYDALCTTKVLHRRFADRCFHYVVGRRLGAAGESGSGFGRPNDVRRVWGCSRSCCPGHLGDRVNRSFSRMATRLGPAGEVTLL
jgi:hypothetical protein